MPTRHTPLTWLAFVAGLLAIWYVSGASMGGPGADRDAMVGTWTEEGGPPGNSIRFYFVTRDIPDMPYIRASEGRATLTKQLGADEAVGQWGYGSLDPLVLNLCLDGRAWFVAIRKVDDDHILIRFGTDAEEMYRADAIDHPDTRRLTKTGP
ncbi:MAG: hypothetical protein J2P46_20690 [Zavarzinella sp.]|nr:hypothetical protein [Zavarzinella sp.]